MKKPKTETTKQNVTIPIQIIFNIVLSSSLNKINGSIPIIVERKNIIKKTKLAILE